MDAAPRGSSSVVETAAGTSASVAAPDIDGDDSAGPDNRRRRGGGRLGPAGPDTDNGDPEGRPFGRTTRGLIAVGVVLVLVIGLVMRFWTVSDLWLDEALTVNIARLPLHEIPSFLKRDGAPPLYYVLLHFWMGWFGTSDEAVRSLSGVFGVVTVPLAWCAGRRLGGRKAGWAAMLLVATSPFAIRYDTETRMYSLVVLLTVCGFLALDRSMRHPRAGNLVAVAAVTGLLLYTHYWSLYLIATVLLWLAWTAWRGQPARRRGARASLVATVIGCATFLPWVPTFLFQQAHTGTPWATPANFAAMVTAVASFAGGNTSQGRALALIFFGLAGLGLFGVATDRLHIELDVRTRPLGRPVAIAVGGTLAGAVAGGFLSNSAFDARYASVVFVPLILMVALGVVTLRDRRVRAIILAGAVLLGVISSIPDVTTNRTQAGQVAAALAADGKPGDVVAYCPDQLGPAVNRLLPEGRYVQSTFPRSTGPVFVNWVNYAAVVQAASPVAFAQHLEALAAAGHQIFVVWAGSYQAYDHKCEEIIETLQGSPSYQVQSVISGNDISFYQPMWMVRFVPTKP
jgi:hypothetical protein